jgi:hypothetical protein
VRLGNTTCNAGQRVAVASKRDRVSDGVFERCGFEETDDGLRNRRLGGLVKFVGGPNLVDSSG